MGALCQSVFDNSDVRDVKYNVQKLMIFMSFLYKIFQSKYSANLLSNCHSLKFGCWNGSKMKIDWFFTFKIVHFFMLIIFIEWKYNFDQFWETKNWIFCSKWGYTDCQNVYNLAFLDPV